MMNDSLGDIIFDKKANGEQNRVCTCGDGELSLKIGRFGAFIGCSKYPDCKFTRPLSRIKAAEQQFLSEPKEIGLNDEGEKIILKMEDLDLIFSLEKMKKNPKMFLYPRVLS